MFWCLVYLYLYGNHRDRHVLTHSFPTRRSSDLLGVAADDAPRPQTHEHLAILDLLGVSRGAGALTKIDRVDPVRVSETAEAVRDMLAGTTLADEIGRAHV